MYQTRVPKYQNLTKSKEKGTLIFYDKRKLTVKIDRNKNAELCFYWRKH